MRCGLAWRDTTGGMLVVTGIGEAPGRRRGTAASPPAPAQRNRPPPRNDSGPPHAPARKPSLSVQHFRGLYRPARPDPGRQSSTSPRHLRRPGDQLRSPGNACRPTHRNGLQWSLRRERRRLSPRAAAGANHAWQDAARIDPNVISRDGSWCSFSLLAGLISKLPMRGPSMETHRALWHVKPTGRSLGSARREPSTGTARARAAHGILVPALVLAGLGAAAPASPGHGSAGHVHASAHQPADSLALSAGADSMTSCNTHSRPWMYSPWASSRPWMYSPGTSSRPWMYSPGTSSRPWMYSPGTSSRPWMYSPGTSSRDKVAFQPAPIPAGLGISRGHDLQRHDGCTFRWLKGAGCRAALLATTRRPVVTAPVGRQRSRCAMRP